jgi:SET domain-containing protein 6
VERWKGDVKQEDSDEHADVPEDGIEDTQANTSIGSAMDIDGTGDGDEALGEESSDSDDEDIDDSSEVSMVPMADLLNARCDSENVSRVGMG